MSQTFLHRFFHLAKTKGKGTAFTFYLGNEYHFIPRWLLRSKIKHFCMGLIHHQAKPGQFFYLFPHHHPQWIYALLGALAAGLKIITIPPNISKEQLQKCSKKYPPSFCYLGQSISHQYQQSLEENKEFKLWIEGHGGPFLQGKKSTFRDIFNSGIIYEGNLFKTYRKIREKILPKDIISPLRTSYDGRWEDSPLKFEHIDLLEENLIHKIPNQKLSRFFSQAKLSYTQDLLLALFWPLATDREGVLLDPLQANSAAFRKFNPRVAYLQNSLVKDLAELKGFPWKRNKGLWDSLKQRGPLRRHFGKRLQLIWHPQALPPEIINSYLQTPFRLERAPFEENFPL